MHYAIPEDIQEEYQRAPHPPDSALDATAARRRDRKRPRVVTHHRPSLPPAPLTSS